MYRSYDLSTIIIVVTIFTVLSKPHLHCFKSKLPSSYSNRDRHKSALYVFSAYDQQSEAAHFQVSYARGSESNARDQRLVRGQEQHEVRTMVVRVSVCCHSDKCRHSGVASATFISSVQDDNYVQK